jgi:hypothetical protein
MNAPSQNVGVLMLVALMGAVIGALVATSTPQAHAQSSDANYEIVPWTMTDGVGAYVLNKETGVVMSISPESDHRHYSRNVITR